MTSREIRHLRKKFIWIAMLSIFLSMLFIGVTVNIMSYIISRISIDRTLDTMIQSAEKIQDEEVGYRLSLSDIFTPEYSKNEFYLISFDSEGEVLVYQSNSRDEQAEKTITAFAETLQTDRQKRGEYLGYYYKCVLDDGQKTAAFLDGSQIISSEFRIFSLTLILGWLGLIITFFLVWHFSGKAIKPEIENNMRQKQFITNASHELKTPLAVIRANTEMVEMTAGESEWTRSTLKQVDHMNGLIQNLVMIAKSEEREDREELDEINVSQAVQESVSPYKSMAEQSGKTLQQDIAPDIMMKIDGSKIRQLTTLLIDNAIKYCDENGTVFVHLDRQKNKKGIILTVSNHYAAGENLDLNHFFDRFYREDQSHNIDQGGYGIGLSIAESICRQYEGSIHAEWKDGLISFICQLK